MITGPASPLDLEIAYHLPMRTLLMIAGLVVAGGGAVWILQGLNIAFAPKSFMTGSQIWVLFGALAVVGGLTLSWWARGRP